MDLAKIIGELKLELQCLDAAITSMEDLARFQNIKLPDALTHPSADPEPAPLDPPPVKRPRGRPRKNPAPVTGTAPEPQASGQSEPGDPSRNPET